ncbi:hypothetical protein PTKU46_82220 [Paraburkholderia terrae]
MARGIGGALVQVATVGTLATSPAGTSPRDWEQRKKDLKALAMFFSAAGLMRFASL